LNSASQQSLFALPGAAEGGDGPGKLAHVKVPTLEDLIAMYDAHWISDWYDSKRQREEYYKKGKAVLKTFYASQEGNWVVPAALESWFKIKVGDYLLHGRIDRIDALPDGTLEIIDYKTGKSKEKVTGEDKEQLLIYQIAAETLSEYRAMGKPSKLTFFYLNDNIRTSFIGDNEELIQLREKLQGTIREIHGGNFTATPGVFVCQHCDFLGICEFRAV
jgi:DNA helicase-2/ATP-dependent DNA helicase PcrA